jgi:hypothetical protein
MLFEALSQLPKIEYGIAHILSMFCAQNIHSNIAYKILIRFDTEPILLLLYKMACFPDNELVFVNKYIENEETKKLEIMLHYHPLIDIYHKQLIMSATRKLSCLHVFASILNPHKLRNVFPERKTFISLLNLFSTAQTSHCNKVFIEKNIQMILQNDLQRFRWQTQSTLS